MARCYAQGEGGHEKNSTGLPEGTDGLGQRLENFMPKKAVKTMKISGEQ